jgi:toxin ParE1/3/4
MVNTVFWTESAKLQLREIYSYYRTVAGQKIADRLKSKIFKKTRLLKKNQFLGVIEPNLDHLGLEHRFLVLSNFKIIYLTQDRNVFITDIFDTRQNPKKINKE